MKSISTEEVIILKYKSQTLRAVYNLAYPNNPYWLNSNTSRVFNIKESTLSNRVAKKYRETFQIVDKSNGFITLEGVTTEGLIKVISNRQKTAAVEEVGEFLKWVETKALPAINQHMKDLTIKESAINTNIPNNKRVNSGAIPQQSNIANTHPTVNKINSVIVEARNIDIENDIGLFELLEFTFRCYMEDYRIRVIQTNAGLNWSITDICHFFNIDNSTAFMEQLSYRYRGVRILDNKAFPTIYEINTINEAGLYKIIFDRHHNPINDGKAFMFQQWIIETVNPFIRKKNYSDIKAKLKAKVIPHYEARVRELNEAQKNLNIITRQYDELKYTSEERLECFTNIAIENRQLTQENLKLKSQLETCIQKLHQAELHIDELLRTNNQAD
ncbi:MAG: BRO family protein [Crinalium sp.]